MPFPRSTERILTTHTGSLPRPDDLVRAMLAREEGEPVDAAALGSADPDGRRRDRRAPGRRRRRRRQRRRDEQAELLDLREGPSHRLRRGEPSAAVPRPRRTSRAGRARRGRSRPRAAQTPACTGPIAVSDPRGAARHRQPQGRRRRRRAESVHDRGLARRHRALPAQPALPEHEDYLCALAEAMRHEYERSPRPGSCSSSTAPTWLGRHIQFADLTSTSSARRRGCTSRRSTTRWRACRPSSAHAPVLGQLPGPAPLSTSRSRDIIDIVFAAPAGGDLVRGGQPAPRPRVARLRDGEAARGQDADPRRDRLDHQLRRAPRAGGRAHRPLRRAGRPRERHRRAPTAASAPSSAQRPSNPTSSGPSSPPWPRAPAWPPRTSGIEPGNAGLHNGIKPDPQLDSFANLPHGVFRKGGDVKVLLDPAGGLRGGQEGRPALDGPGEQDLRRGLVDSLGDSGDDRIFQQLGLATMPQRRESLQHDAILSAIVQKFPFRQIRMGFDVNNRRLDPPGFKDLFHLFQADVG